MTRMTRGFQAAALLAIACALPLAMGACPSVDPAIDPIINPHPGDQVADPVFNPPGGPFHDTIEVTISCATPGATIRYTLDSTVPSESNGAVYTGPILLDRTTTVRATAFHDSLDPSDQVTAIYSRAAGRVLAISSPAAACTLVQGQPGTIDVHCMVAATLCEVESVTADLSAIGGAGAQPLTRFGDYWSWFGTVTPPAAGTCTITFTAADTTGGTATASVTTVVSPAPVGNAAPVISSASVAGQLVRYQAGTVTISCIAADADGTVQTVRADLSAIGGPSAQYLALASGTWSWTGPVTPVTAGVRTITFTAFDNQGASGTAAATISVAASNSGPLISSASVPASLWCNQSNTVTISCTATDADGTVQRVTADLSAIGGPADQALSQSGSLWQWSGSVTPTLAGLRTVTITATDDDGLSTVASRTIQVTTPNQPPSIGDPQASGELYEAAQGTVTVSCTAADPDTGLASVVADLSAIGGSSAQSLSLSGGRYTWTGELTPQSRGSRTITFIATDTQNATASTTTTIEVAPPNAAPTVTNAAATGDLALNQSCSVTVTCDAADSDGTVQSVTADLSTIGGAAAQALALSEGHWTWTGFVTPTSTGQKTVTFTATDNKAGTGSGSATITVYGSQSDSLAGAWAGDVVYLQALVFGGSPGPSTTFHRQSTVTFSSGPQPQALAVYFGQSAVVDQVQTRVVVLLPAAGLLNPGDQSTAATTVSGLTTTVTGTVVQVTRSATAFAIDLNLHVVQTGAKSGTWTGPYHWEAALLPGNANQMSWSETTMLDLQDKGIGLSVNSNATLTRQ